MRNEKNNCELEILISTFGEEGLLRLSRSNLPHLKEVRYLVSCQSPDQESLPVPDKLLREDLRIIFTRTKGLSINRNFAITHATAPICLIADDDISFTRDAFSAILSAFKANPDIDIMTFEFTGPDGEFEKPYPSYSFPLEKPAKGYYISSIEIAFRRIPVIESGILFNENFGLGNSHFGSGEDELWVHDLLKYGLKGRFIPHLIAIHNDSNTTGLRLMATPSLLRAQGAVIKRLYPYTALLRVFLKAWRSSKATRKDMLFCLRPLLQGWWEAAVHPRRTFGTR